MDSSDSTSAPKGKAWQLGHDVLAALEQHSVPPIPENYAIWFRHLSGMDSVLSEEIRHREERGEPFDVAYTRHLYSHHAQMTGEAERQVKLIGSTQDILTDALSVITSIIMEADTHNAEIEEQLDSIIGKDSHADLNTILEALLTVAKEMKKSSKTMRSSLEESRKEVEELKKDLADVSVEAQRDFLTGILNRKALDTHMTELMGAAARNDTPLAMLVLDIDHFKRFNDSFGHVIGDEVLKMVAKILNDSVKGQDIVARFGGEEFVILLPSTSLGGAMVVAENIRKLIASKEMRHRGSGDTFGSVSVSIGVAAYKPGEDTAKTWLERADDALYRSKRAGRNRVTQETLSEPKVLPSTGSKAAAQE